MNEWKAVKTARATAMNNAEFDNETKDRKWEEEKGKNRTGRPTQHGCHWPDWSDGWRNRLGNWMVEDPCLVLSKLFPYQGCRGFQPDWLSEDRSRLNYLDDSMIQSTNTALCKPSTTTNREICGMHGRCTIQSNQSIPI